MQDGLRCISFVDPGDAEFKETTKNARKKLQVPWEAAMLCKIRSRQCKEICGKSGTHRSKYACIVETNESTESVWNGTNLKIMKITSWERGTN